MAQVASNRQGGMTSMDFEDDIANYKGPVNDSMPAYVRAGFVRKVYFTLSMQLILTFLIAMPFKAFLSPSWVHSHAYLSQVASVIAIAVMIGTMCCCKDATRTYPGNYVFLLVITVCISITVGFLTAIYKTDSVLLALGATVMVFGSLTAYAKYTKSDFTGMGPYLMAALMSLMGFGFVLSLFSMFASVPPVMQTLYALGGTLIFSMYIVYDTQQILGGRSIELGVDEYVFAALNLYLDIINLFITLLQLMGQREN